MGVRAQHTLRTSSGIVVLKLELTPAWTGARPISDGRRASNVSEIMSIDTFVPIMLSAKGTPKCFESINHEVNRDCRDKLLLFLRREHRCSKFRGGMCEWTLVPAPAPWAWVIVAEATFIS